MASEYTSHYNLDLYADSDKPNLRDQYNGAMNKVDQQLYKQSVDTTTANNNANNAVSAANAASKAAADEATRAKEAEASIKNTADSANSAAAAASKAAADEAARAKEAEGAIRNTADSALSKANANAAQIAQNTTTTFKAGAYKDVDTAPASGSANLITSGAVHSALAGLNTSIADGSITAAKLANGAVATDKIADGAVTAAKIAQSAKDAIMGGMTIKIFGNKIPGADNTGAGYPSNMEMAGAYIPALDLLIIWKIHIVTGANWSSTNPLVLPSYVPSMHSVPSGDAQFGVAGIEWTNDNYFKSWYGIIFDGRKIYTASTINDNFDSFPLVISCAPFRDGATNTIV